MAEMETDTTVVEEQSPKGIKLPVLIGIILGIIVIQAGIVLAALKIFAPSSSNHTKDVRTTLESTADTATGDEDNGPILVQKVEGIVTPKSDLFINPRGSSTHIVVMSLGIEVSPKEKAKEVEDQLMIPIQDRVISRISSYTLEELQDSRLRDSLRIIIRDDIRPYFNALEGVRLRNVYFPKFVIQ